jgi:Na+/H+ antiporter NhaA
MRTCDTTDLIWKRRVGLVLTVQCQRFLRFLVQGAASGLLLPVAILIAVGIRNSSDRVNTLLCLAILLNVGPRPLSAIVVLALFGGLLFLLIYMEIPQEIAMGNGRTTAHQMLLFVMIKSITDVKEPLLSQPACRNRI